MRWHRLTAVIRKEFIQILRDPPSLVISLAMPVLMLLLFGYAVTTDVNNIALAVLDQDRQQPGRQLAAVLEQTGYFAPVYHVESLRELEGMLDSGRAKAGLVIPRGYARELRRGEEAQAQFLVDGSDPLIARTALSTAEITARVYSQKLLLRQLEASGGEAPRGPAVDLRTRAYYNPGLESMKFNVPGLIGLVLQNITIMLTAFALVRERERGTLEQLMVTPVRGGELMVGKLIPYILIAFVDVAFVLAVGTLWFGVPVRGSLPLLLGLALLFLVFALGLGILFSTVARTQLQAMQMAMAFILPSVLLSGFIFPREAMPDPIRWLGYAIPMTYFLEILRGIMLKGVGMAYLWRDIVPLTVFGVGVVGLAALRFRKQIE
ncbi:MAG: ABC transporter permease [Thermoanaerobacterales bacterium]|nr:ABC transporter permease [Bacillota bacterium]MDI6907590.1 ABC transporter permease [Thermoanaerobacterales bacterium]